MFTGVSGINASGDRLPWFEQGRYRVRITGCRGVNSRQGDTFYIVETEVLVVHQTDVPEKMVSGRHYGQMIKFNADMGPINTKRFVLCAMGYDPNIEANQALVGDDEVNYSVGDEQPFAGLEMELHCEGITTQKGNPFTKHNWTPCDPAQWGAPPPAPPQAPPQPFQGVPVQAVAPVDQVGVALGVVPQPAAYAPAAAPQPAPVQTVVPVVQPAAYAPAPAPVVVQPAAYAPVVAPVPAVAQPAYAPAAAPVPAAAPPAAAPPVAAPAGFPSRGVQQ